MEIDDHLFPSPSGPPTSGGPTFDYVSSCTIRIIGRKERDDDGAGHQGEEENEDGLDERAEARRTNSRLRHPAQQFAHFRFRERLAVDLQYPARERHEQFRRHLDDATTFPPLNDRQAKAEIFEDNVSIRQAHGAQTPVVDIRKESGRWLLDSIAGFGFHYGHFSGGLNGGKPKVILN